MNPNYSLEEIGDCVERWRTEILEEDVRCSREGEAHPNYGEDFERCVSMCAQLLNFALYGPIPRSDSLSARGCVLEMVENTIHECVNLNGCKPTQILLSDSNFHKFKRQLYKKRSYNLDYAPDFSECVYYGVPIRIQPTTWTHCPDCCTRLEPRGPDGHWCPDCFGHINGRMFRLFGISEDERIETFHASKRRIK